MLHFGLAECSLLHIYNISAQYISSNDIKKDVKTEGKNGIKKEDEETTGVLFSMGGEED